MKCPACESTEQLVMTTRPVGEKIVRLRRCGACGHRWRTIEMTAENLSLLEKAAEGMRQLAMLVKEINSAAPSHVNRKIPDLPRGMLVGSLFPPDGPSCS